MVTTQSVFGRRMWTAWLLTPSYLGDPRRRDKIREAYTTLEILGVHVWAMGLASHDLLAVAKV